MSKRHRCDIPKTVGSYTCFCGLEWSVDEGEVGVEGHKVVYAIAKRETASGDADSEA